MLWFLGFFSCRLMVQSDHFLCNVFRMYLVWGLAFMVCFFFVGFVITSYFWGFGYGLARFEFRVTVWHGNEEDQGAYTH